MKYGIIVEFKNQGPILMESEKMDYSAVVNQMDSLLCSSRVIRVCMVSLSYESGNESLIKGDDK